MCTNALVDSLELYMDDLVECFEDFIKKSLILITVAMGAVVAIFLYLMKTVTERTDGLRPTLPLPETPQFGPTNVIRVSDASIQSKSFQNIMDPEPQQSPSTNELMHQDNKVRNTSTSVSKVPTMTTMNSITDTDKNTSYFASNSKIQQNDQGINSNANENSRLEIPSIKTLIATRPCNECASRSSWRNSLMLRSCSTSRLTGYNGGVCMPRHHLAPSHPCSRLIPIRTSCCSMCCADDDRR